MSDKRVCSECGENTLTRWGGSWRCAACRVVLREPGRTPTLAQIRQLAAEVRAQRQANQRTGARWHGSS